MPDHPIAHKKPVFSSSAALAALGKALGEIKAQDGLTWDDVGAVLGVKGNQAAKYADGMTAMSAVTFGLGKRNWNGRFTGYFDRLCVESRPGAGNDRTAPSAVLSAALVLTKAAEHGGEISTAEIRDNRQVLEAAFDALAEHLSKLKLEQVI